jgi:hypothetical protein
MKYKLLLSILVVALTACSDAKTKLKGEFLAGCIQSGGDKSTCSCVFEDLQEKYNFNSSEELEKIVYLDPKSYMEDMGNSVAICRNNS